MAIGEIRLDSGSGLTAAFVPGAGMVGVSLEDSGVELLGQRAGLSAYLADGKTMGLPILYPWANRLAGDGYEFEGETVELGGEAPGLHRDENGLPIHGILAASPLWRVESTDPADHPGKGAFTPSEAETGRASLKATLEFGEHPDLLRSFPFPHRLELEIILNDRSLELTTTVTPTGDDSVPLAYGFHPYLTLPGIDRREWMIETPPMIELETDERGIPTGRRAEVPPRAFLLGEQSIDRGYFGLEPGSRFSLQGAGRRITVEFVAGFSAAQIFAPTADDVVCFEPMKSPTAALSSGRELAVVEPGERDVSKFSITVEDPMAATPPPADTEVPERQEEVPHQPRQVPHQPMDIPYRLRRGAPADEVLTVIRGRAASAAGQLRGAGSGSAGEAVHEARKDMKKVRSALRLVRGGLGDAEFRSENRRFRDAARLLSGMRDTRVMAETVASLIDRYPESAPALEPTASELHSRLDQLDRGSDESDAEGRMWAAADAIEEGLAGLSDLELEDRGWKSFRDGLQRSYRDGRRILKRLEGHRTADGPDHIADDVHEWRKRVKDLWYQLRLLRNAWKKGLAGPVHEASTLADLLGDYNDLTVLGREFGGSESGDPDFDELNRLTAKRQAELLNEAMPIGRRLYAEKPSRFTDRIGRYWNA